MRAVFRKGPWRRKTYRPRRKTPFRLGPSDNSATRVAYRNACPFPAVLSGRSRRLSVRKRSNSRQGIFVLNFIFLSLFSLSVGKGGRGVCAEKRNLVNFETGKHRIPFGAYGSGAVVRLFPCIRRGQCACTVSGFYQCLFFPYKSQSSRLSLGRE